MIAVAALAVSLITLAAVIVTYRSLRSHLRRISSVRPDYLETLALSAAYPKNWLDSGEYERAVEQFSEMYRQHHKSHGA